jgi:transposase-like protein
MAAWHAGCSALPTLVDGMNRKRAARQAGMDRQTLRDWVIRFNAEGIEGLRDRPRSGRPPWPFSSKPIRAQHRVELASVDGVLESDACWLTIRNFLVQLSVRAERPRVIVAQSPMKPALAAPDDQAMGADLFGIAQCTPEPGRDLPRVSAEVPHHAQHIVMHLIPRRDSG